MFVCWCVILLIVLIDPAWAALRSVVVILVGDGGFGFWSFSLIFPLSLDFLVFALFLKSDFGFGSFFAFGHLFFYNFSTHFSIFNSIFFRFGSIFRFSIGFFVLVRFFEIHFRLRYDFSLLYTHFWLFCLIFFIFESDLCSCLRSICKIESITYRLAPNLIRPPGIQTRPSPLICWSIGAKFDRQKFKLAHLLCRLTVKVAAANDFANSICAKSFRIFILLIVGVQLIDLMTHMALSSILRSDI